MDNSASSHLDAFQANRPWLFAIAYRMLGSASEADDVLQDAFIRFQGVALDEIECPKAYLSTIVTRLCLNQLTSARSQREAYLGPWLPEPVHSAGHPELSSPEDQAADYDSISIAFLALLEHLTPAERAVFLLREVFDYEYIEISEMLGKSEAACRKLFSRAKTYIAAHRPRFTVSPQAHRRLLEEFMQAAGSGDLDGLMTLLAEDATLWADGGGKVRGAALQPVYGRQSVALFVVSATARFTPDGARYSVVDVNGRPTLLISYPDATPAIVVSIEVGEERIQAVWVVANPDKLGGLKQ